MKKKKVVAGAISLAILIPILLCGNHRTIHHQYQRMESCWQQLSGISGTSFFGDWRCAVRSFHFP